MRWEELFDDLEGQFEAARDAEIAGEVSDRARRELGVVRLVDRLRAATGQTLSIRVAGVGMLEGRLVSVGPDWLLIAEAAGREALVASHGLLSVGGLPAQSAAPARFEAVAKRLTLAFALRGVVRDRAAVTLGYIDGSTTTGTLDRVGCDFVEIAEHALDQPRRPGVVRAVRTVPFTALALARRV